MQENTKLILRDDYHNTAVIQEVFTAPFYGAKKQRAFRLVVADSEKFIYFVSVYETVTDAMKKVKSLSCGTFKEV